MATPQQRRKLRIKNDYKEMLNIKGSIVQWQALTGTPPYVESYRLIVRVRSIIGPGPRYRETHTIRVVLPPDYPTAAPMTIMESQPVVFHPNWWPDGKWCHGAWDLLEGLGYFIVRMLRTLQFDTEITNPRSPANRTANDWYVSNTRRGYFPCDLQVLPDPTLSRFSVQTQTPKKFQIEQ